MNDPQKQSDLDHRWDIHTERQIAAAKGGIAAVTVLNSGSWLALLSQADKFASIPGGLELASIVIRCWGFGAFFGTLTWLFLYLSAGAQKDHDFDRKNPKHIAKLDWWYWLGMGSVILAMLLFAMGVLQISYAFSP